MLTRMNGFLARLIAFADNVYHLCEANELNVKKIKDVETTLKVFQSEFTYAIKHLPLAYSKLAARYKELLKDFKDVKNDAPNVAKLAYLEAKLQMFVDKLTSKAMELGMHTKI